MKRIAWYVALLLAVPIGAAAQWSARPAPGVPRTADGRVNLTAPPPHTAGGTPDLSGLWTPEPDPNGKVQGVENTVFPRYLVDITQDVKDRAILVAAADALYRKRLANDGTDDPNARCQPPGAARIVSLARPVKIVETPGLTLLLYEHDTIYRQVFTDGRALPDDPFPTWMGYSVGKWEGDTFVVRTIGLTERSWLDLLGHPHSDALVMTERFRRVDVGHMDVQVTLVDPGVFAEPLTLTQKLRLLADQELIEYFCNDNEKDLPHYTTVK